MAIIIGSARVDEKGTYSGGAAGDQKQTSFTYDTKGEVSMQNLYTHSKGWYILRPLNPAHAKAIAAAMVRACNNPNIGYSQSSRLGVVANGTNSSVKTNADCSSLVRTCIKEGTGKDPGNFTTANAVSSILATGLFENRGAFVSQTATPVCDGDILNTKTKGHIVIVCSGNPRSNSNVVAKNVPPLASPIVKRGYKGAQAKYLQQDLNYIMKVGLAEDGDFGIKSEAALLAFQKQYGLEVDGIYGSKSQAKVRELLK